MNKHTAICPNGSIVTRNSKTKKYSHCIVVWSDWQKCWVVAGWASRLDLAQNVLNQRNNIFNNGMSCKDIDVQNYFKINYGDKLQCQIVKATIA
jgi:hypothetical protein